MRRPRLWPLSARAVAGPLALLLAAVVLAAAGGLLVWNGNPPVQAQMVTAPEKPTGLSAARGPGSGQVSLTHVAPGGGYNNPTGGTARVAAQATEIDLWSATLTVAKHSDNEWYGFGTDSSGTYGIIDPASFTNGDTTYHIKSLISSQAISGQALFIRILNSPGFRNVMTLTVGGRDFEGSAATTSSGNTGFSWLTNPAFTWAVGDTVAVSLKATLPGAPANFKAVAGDSEVALSWDDPSDDTITKYQYRQKTGSGGFGNWTDITCSIATTTSHTVTSLTNGTAYSFQVRAAVATLAGVASGTVTATPVAQIELWSATLTVGQSPSPTLGYRLQFNYGALSPNNFTYDRENCTISTLEQRESNKLDFGFTPDFPFKSVVTLALDGERFPASAADSLNLEGGLTWSNSDLTWAVGDTVAVSLRAIRPVAPANFKGRPATAKSPFPGMIRATPTSPVRILPGGRARQAHGLRRQSTALRGDEFGFSVSVDGDIMVVGVYRDDDDGGSNSGSAYVFVGPSTGWSRPRRSPS